MTDPNIIALAQKIAPSPPIAPDQYTTYHISKETHSPHKDSTTYYLSNENNNSIALPQNCHLNDIHTILQYIHPNNHYHIKYCLDNIPHVHTGIYLYSYGHQPKIATLTPTHGTNIQRINLRPIADIIDEEQSLDDIINTMQKQTQQHFYQPHNHPFIQYHFSYIDGQYPIPLPNDGRIDIQLMIWHATINSPITLHINTYIHENIHHIKKNDYNGKAYINNYAFTINLSDIQHQRTTYNQHIPRIFQELIEIFPRYFPNHSQHSIAQIHRMLTQQQYDPNHPIYATITHYISQFTKHYNMPTN